MALGKLAIVFFTCLIVNSILESNGVSFSGQILASISIGFILGAVDAFNEDKKQ